MAIPPDDPVNPDAYSAPIHDEADAEDIARAIEDDVSDAYLARGRSPESPEARAEIAERTVRAQRARGLWQREMERVGPGTRAYEIAKRVAVGTYMDGFIHAGNLAYLALIALFPFFILTAALIGTFSSAADADAAVGAVLSTVPPSVADTLAAPLREVMHARSGWLLWLGALVALWTVGSLIETIRDILRRAYGTQFDRSFWHYRLVSIGIIVGAVILLLLSFSAQVVLTAVTEAITRLLPDQLEHAGSLLLSRAISAAGLFLALYLLFLTLTPHKYRHRTCPKWPGALVTAGWWVAVTLALPPLLAGILSYDLTYGSMAGVMVALFFFYLVGLGVVVGAELNAALVETPAECHDDVGQSDNRIRKERT